jgi:hypothetical protein
VRRRLPLLLHCTSAPAVLVLDLLAEPGDEQVDDYVDCSSCDELMLPAGSAAA